MYHVLIEIVRNPILLLAVTAPVKMRQWEKMLKEAQMVVEEEDGDDLGM
jgi:hypothetical protein